MNGMAPDLGIVPATSEGSRSGLTLKIPPKSGSKESVQTLKDQFFTTYAPRMYNALPKVLRSLDHTFESFKGILDLFLEVVPDRPVLAGYVTGNLAPNGYRSNSLLDWLRNNPDMSNWIPECAVEK